MTKIVIGDVSRDPSRKSNGDAAAPDGIKEQQRARPTRMQTHSFHRGTIDVKTFLRFFLFWSRFYVLNVFFIFETFFRKRWQSSERQAV